MYIIKNGLLTDGHDHAPLWPWFLAVLIAAALVLGVAFAALPK